MYVGQAFERGGTSIKGKGAAPPLRYLFENGYINKGATILDYGAGKYSRNANFLRQKGCRVFAYDPYNGSYGGDGWIETSRTKPTNAFDIVFTCYVLNVVPEHIEDEIIADAAKLAPVQYHITRNIDIVDSVLGALQRKDNVVGEFFLQNFANAEQAHAFKNNKLTKAIVEEFCYFGTRTRKGFQRIPVLENKKLILIHKTNGYKIYRQHAKKAQLL